MMSVFEANALGLHPYAVYGGKVYSFKYSPKDKRAVPHGSDEYARVAAKLFVTEKKP